ncbi:MAG: peptidylprolyl isomerase [Spirochaetia bacterium]
MNKGQNIIVLALIYFFVSSVLFAQDRVALTARPIATVILAKTEFLTTQKFSEELKGVETVTGQKLPTKGRLQLREKMIDNIVVTQVAERAKVRPDEKEILDLLRGQVNKPDASLKDLKDMYEKSPASKIQTWDSLLQRLRSESMMSNYFRKEITRDSIKQPSDAEVKKAYAEHKASFVMPTTVRVSHVFFSFKGSATKAEAKQKADKALAEINSGNATFEEQVRKYSEDRDSSTRLGDIGYITDMPQARQMLGNQFIDAAIRLRAGQSSGVVGTAEGYHILKVTEKQPQKQLTLTDSNPSNPRTTVYQLVEQQLMEMQYRKKIEELVKKLRSEAKITINEDSWKPWVSET